MTNDNNNNITVGTRVQYARYNGQLVLGLVCRATRDAVYLRDRATGRLVAAPRLRAGEPCVSRVSTGARD